MTTAPPDDQPLAGHDEHDHDRGLAFDLSTLLNRRRMLQLIGGAGVLRPGRLRVEHHGRQRHHGRGIGQLGRYERVECRLGDDGVGHHARRRPARPVASGGSVGVIAEETAGPFPGDGSNGVNVLTESGIVRQDIRPSFGSSSGTAEGVASTVAYTVVDASTGNAGLGRRGVHVALRPGRAVLAVLPGRRRPELPAGSAGDGRQRRGHLHHDLPRVLLGPLAPHPLRGLPEPRRGHGRRHAAGDLADRPAGGRLDAGLRHGRLRAERREPVPGVAVHRHGVQRRRRDGDPDGDRVGRSRATPSP